MSPMSPQQSGGESRAAPRAVTALRLAPGASPGVVSSAVPLRPQSVLRRRVAPCRSRGPPPVPSSLRVRARLLARDALDAVSPPLDSHGSSVRARAMPPSSRSPRVGPEHPNNNAFVDFLKTAGERVKSTFAHDESSPLAPCAARSAAPAPRRATRRTPRPRGRRAPRRGSRPHRALRATPRDGHLHPNDRGEGARGGRPRGRQGARLRLRRGGARARRGRERATRRPRPLPPPRSAPGRRSRRLRLR